MEITPPAPQPRPSADEPWPEQLDEVGLDLGPDAARGLLDPYEASGDSTATGERTAPREGGDGHDSLTPDARRAALVARLFSLAAPDPADYAAAEGQPCAPLKRRLAEESLDPLALPVGSLTHQAPPEEVGVTTRPWSAAELAEALSAAPRPAPEPSAPYSPTPSPRSAPSWPWFAALLALSLLAWWRWG